MSRHYSLDALTRLLQGEAHEAETAAAVRHVLHCRSCWAVAASCLGEGERGGGLPLRLPETRDALLTLLGVEVDGPIEILKAESWWAEIRDLGPREQIRKIRSTAALQSLPVFETILAEARVTGRSDPFLGEGRARTAQVVADLLPESRTPPGLKNDLRAECLTVVANCRRLAADFGGAAEVLEEARSHLRKGTGNLGVEAGLLSIRASLSSDLGDFEKALVHARQAIELYRRLEDRLAVAHNTVLEAGCLIASQRPAEAIERASAAWEMLPPHEIRLRALARLTQVDGLILQDRPLEALPYFMEARELCEQGDLGLRLRAVYHAARLLEGLGNARESEKLFRYTIRSYFENELYKEAFITLLSLFECYCARGALDKAAALCEEAIAATSEAGAACNEQIRRTWEELLTTVRSPQLTATELIQARQFLVRNWSAPQTVAFVLPQREATPPVAAPPELPRPALVAEEAAAGPTTFQAAREAYDRELLVAALRKAGGNLTEASRLLGFSRNTLRSRMRAHSVKAEPPE